MNQANNLRSRTTKMKIRSAAADLLQTTTLQRLTVRAICEKAGLNRSSFYVHYQDVFDMMEKLSKDHEEEILAVYAEAGGGDSDYFSRRNMEIILEYMKENRHFYKAFFKGFGTGIIERGFNLLYESIYQPFYLSRGFPSEYGHYYFTFFKNGLLSVVREWLERDCPETPEELVSIIGSSLPSVLNKK